MILEGPAPPGPHRHADGLRAVVLSAIGRSDPELGRWLHDANQPKPLAIGPLETVPDDPGILAVEVSVTADPVIEPLLTGLPRTGAPIVLGRCRYTLRDARVVRAATFDEMCAEPPPGHSIRIRLLTPTAHHQPGTLRRSIVVPDPRLYLGSWLGRWNLFANMPFDAEFLEAAAESVVVSAFEGRTRAAPLDGRRVFLGFVGMVEFRALDGGRPAAPIAAAMWALARFAEFGGTGIETMRGMGQTRIAGGSCHAHPLH
jgi:CRISPR-associated endoribonuclease Cas6